MRHVTRSPNGREHAAVSVTENAQHTR
jgi:hypothetical protein